MTCFRGVSPRGWRWLAYAAGLVPAAGIAPVRAQTAIAPLILTLPVSVRAAGLGGAGVALAGDASAAFINPAGLATIRHIALEGAAQRYPDGSLEGMAAGAFRLFQFDLGGGVHYLRMSDTSAVRENLHWTGAGVYRVGILALGGSLRYVSLRDSAGRVRRAAATDAGLGIHVFDLMTLAFAARNVAGWRVSGDPILVTGSRHAAFSFNFVDPQETGRLLTTLEIVWADREPRRTVIGLEAGAVLGQVGLVGRAGYGAAPAGAGQDDLSLGGSVVLTRVTLDYAWQGRTRLGGHIHRLGFRFTL